MAGYRTGLKELLATHGDARLLSVRIRAEALKKLAGSREVSPALEAIYRLRMVKSAKKWR